MLLRRMLVPGAADEFHGTADYMMDAPLDDGEAQSGHIT